MLLPKEYAVWQPPVENQKGANNCAAQAFCNVLECIEYKRTGVHRNYSVGFMHGNPLNTAKSGMYLDDGVKILLEFGNVYRDVWESEFGGQLVKTLWLSQVTEDITKQANKLIRGAVKLNTKTERQKYIFEYGLPIIIVADAKHFGVESGTHAVAVYGWDTDGMMLYTNSYGIGYGDNGRGKIKDEYITESIGLIPIEDEGEEIMRGVEHLHPKLQAVCAEFVKQCNAKELNVKITDTLRTEEEQNTLYAQGRTAPGSIVTNVKYPNSAHNWGVAFDFCRNEKGREYDDSDGFFEKVGAIGKSLGLFWGGDFKSFTDKPHFEMPEFMPDNSTKWLKKTYGTPEEFMQSWDALSDIADSWAKADIEYLVDLGIVNGYADGTFKPKQVVTREEMAAIIARTIRYLKG